MNLQFILGLVLASIFLTPSSAWTQAQKKAVKGASAEEATKEAAPPDAAKSTFVVMLEERMTPRKVFMPYLDPHAGPNGKPRPPYVASVYAFRVVRNDRPDEGFIWIQTDGSGFYWDEDHVRRFIQFKKDFEKRRATIPDHVDHVQLRLVCHGTEFTFNLRTGQCEMSHLQVPDGFFDALADALDDLQKLKAGKPSFRVK
jgi:hypothetical protein